MGKSLSELRDFALGKKGDGETVYGYYFLRRVSPLATWVFLRLGVSANFVTLTALLIALSGSFMFSSTSIYFWIGGWILYQFYYILDCSDGEVAVITNTTSEFGAFLDKISHPITNSAIIFMSAFGAYRITGSLPLLIFSASGAIMFNLTSVMRYFAQNKSSETNRSKNSSNKKRSENVALKGFRIAKNLATRPGGITHPLLGLLLVDLMFGTTYRIFYPALASFMGIILVLKRFNNLRRTMK